MFTEPDVKEQLGRFVLARLFTDGEGETVATFLGLTRDREEFLDFLRKAL